MWGKIIFFGFGFVCFDVLLRQILGTEQRLFRFGDLCRNQVL